MTTCVVEITDAALAAIEEQARYIAEEWQAPSQAQSWLEGVFDAVESLERWPRRASVAQESAHVDYEIRQILVGSHLLLFRVDEEAARVTIVGLRHRHRLPHRGNLAEDGRVRDDAPDSR